MRRPISSLRRSKDWPARTCWSSSRPATGQSNNSSSESYPKTRESRPSCRYPDLLPKTSVMVTNGGYGGVQMALSYGVPLVVAGASEDKPEVAARVAWSGAGLNLKTGKPKPQAVRVAVRAVLDDPRYRARAQTLASQYRSYDPIARVIQIVETITSASSADARRRSGSETRSVERLVLRRRHPLETRVKGCRSRRSVSVTVTSLPAAILPVPAVDA